MLIWKKKKNYEWKYCAIKVILPQVTKCRTIPMELKMSIYRFFIFIIMMNILSLYSTQGNKEDTTTLHVLGLLKELLSAFPLNSVKSCCETLLRVMTLSHVVREQFNSYICHFYLISILNTCFWFFEAGDCKCNAGFPQTFQQQTQSFHYVCRAQCPNHHSECHMHVNTKDIVLDSMILFLPFNFIIFKCVDWHIYQHLPSRLYMTMFLVRMICSLY